MWGIDLGQRHYGMVPDQEEDNLERTAFPQSNYLFKYIIDSLNDWLPFLCSFPSEVTHTKSLRGPLLSQINLLPFLRESW